MIYALLSLITFVAIYALLGGPALTIISWLGDRNQFIEPGRHLPLSGTTSVEQLRPDVAVSQQLWSVHPLPSTPPRLIPLSRGSSTSSGKRRSNDWEPCFWEATISPFSTACTFSSHQDFLWQARASISFSFPVLMFITFNAPLLLQPVNASPQLSHLLPLVVPWPTWE